MWSSAGSPAGDADAQTLDQQYQHFLADKCANLSFERDGEYNLLPGQAGPNLAAFCSGMLIVAAADTTPGGGSGSSTSTGAAGGGAGAAAARGRAAADDVALRNRRERARDDGDRSVPSADNVAVAEIGRTGIFLSLDRRFERQRVTHFEDGRQSHSLAGTVGADYRLGTKLVAGLALSYTDLSGSFTGGGDFRMYGRGEWIYASWLPVERAFLDVSAGVEVDEQTTRRLVGLRTVTEFADRTAISIQPPFRLTDGSSRVREKGLDVGGGYDVVVHNVTLGPRARLVARRKTVGGFLESGATPMTLAFDRQTSTSLRTVVGVQASRALKVQNVPVIAQFDLDWLHEFRDDQRVMTARFAEDLRSNAPRLAFLTDAPDRDWYDVRASAVAVFSKRLTGFLSLESTFGHEYIHRYGVSLGLRREF